MKEVVTTIRASPVQYAAIKPATLIFRVFAIVKAEARKFIFSGHGFYHLLTIFKGHAMDVKETLMLAGVRNPTGSIALYKYF